MRRLVHEEPTDDTVCITFLFSLTKTLIKLKNIVKNYESDEKSVQILSNANTAKTVTIMQ